MALLASTAFVLDPAFASRVTGDVLPGLGFGEAEDAKDTITVLDTVDWQLWQAELALLVGGGRMALWPLSCAGYPLTLRAPETGLFDVASMGPGVFRRRLEAIVGEAALLPMAAIETKAERFVHRNSQGKIDCRAELVRASVDGLCPLPPLLIPEPLRGYEGEARPLVAKLSAGLAEAPAAAERLRVWLYATGRVPGDSIPPATPIQSDMASDQAVALCLRRSLARIEDRARLAQADREPEHLHQLRVAVRQARGLLKGVGSALPPKVAARGAKGLKWLGDVSTPVRDLDVLLAGDARAFSGDLQSALLERRVEARAHLGQALASQRWQRFLAKWRRDLTKVCRKGKGGQFQAAADAALMVAAERFVLGAQALSDASPPEALHELRKHGKQLRYLLDFFRDLYPKRAVKALIRPLKRAQDGLGAYQDLTAHQDLLQAFDEAAPFLASLAAEEPARRADAMAALAPFREPDALAAYQALVSGDAAELAHEDPQGVAQS